MKLVIAVMLKVYKIFIWKMCYIYEGEDGKKYRVNIIIKFTLYMKVRVRVREI